MAQRLIYILPLGLFAALALIFALPMIQNQDPTYVPDTLVGDPIPAFTIEGLAPADIHGPALVNIFASWCAPCKEEHKLLISLKETGALPLYGINYKDTAENRDKFLKVLGNPYKKIGNDPQGLAAIAFGISGVPTSFLIDPAGRVIRRFDGPLTPADIALIAATAKGERP